MKHARFCIASLLLETLAVGIHFGALRAWSENAGIRARAVSVTQEQRLSMRVVGDRLSQRGSVLYVVGVCLAIAGAACLVVSFRRDESARWRPVPVALLIFYGVFQFVMV